MGERRLWGDLAAGDRREGMAVSSYSPVPLEPPLVVVVMETVSLTLKRTLPRRCLAIFLLAADDRLF
jgi:flavin reductase (DIM6/NTAB) family NADH-FMN oxidoreductase RutF